MCFVERTDGNKFGDVSEIAFANSGGPPGTPASIMQADAGGRLFFVLPPVEAAGDEVVVLDTGEQLPLEASLTSTGDPLEAARSLRTQMEVVGQAMAAFVSAQALSGVIAGDALSIYLTVVGDAALRLADCLEGLGTTTIPPADSATFQDIIDGLVNDNQSRMDVFLSTAFNF